MVVNGYLLFVGVGHILYSMTEFMSVPEFAEATGKHINTIRQWIKDGYLTASRAPGLRSRWMIPRTELERLKTTSQETP